MDIIPLMQDIKRAGFSIPTPFYIELHKEVEEKFPYWFTDHVNDMPYLKDVLKYHDDEYHIIWYVEGDIIYYISNYGRIIHKKVSSRHTYEYQPAGIKLTNDVIEFIQGTIYHRLDIIRSYNARWMEIVNKMLSGDTPTQYEFADFPFKDL